MGFFKEPISSLYSERVLILNLGKQTISVIKMLNSALEYKNNAQLKPILFLMCMTLCLWWSFNHSGIAAILSFDFKNIKLMIILTWKKCLTWRTFLFYFSFFIEWGVQELHGFCSISGITILFISDHLHSSLMGCRVELMALWICFQFETVNDLGSLYSIFVFSEDPYWVLLTHVLPIPFIYLHFTQWIPAMPFLPFLLMFYSWSGTYCVNFTSQKQ